MLFFEYLGEQDVLSFMEVAQDFGDAFTDVYSGGGEEAFATGDVFCGEFEEALEGTRQRLRF